MNWSYIYLGNDYFQIEDLFEPLGRQIIAQKIRKEDYAYLIAAAPDLLEACKAAKSLIANAIEFINDGNPPIPNTPQEKISDLYQVLYSAIAKAEGK